ncbi:MAG TPA: hypothetical protein DCM05_04270 [Elusimicrobia bacterium]|nr:hypothetical protein [Elusimicrobiota bacterium]
MMPENAMDHDKITEFLDGELTTEERERFQAHLASCPDCRRAVEDWRKTSRVFFGPVPALSSADRELFVRKVMARLPEEEAAPWRWLVPALGFSFALFALSFLPSQQEQTDPLKTLLLADAGAAQSADPLDELVGLGDER